MQFYKDFWPNGKIQTSVVQDENGRMVSWRAWQNDGSEFKDRITRQEMEIILEQDEEFRIKNESKT